MKDDTRIQNADTFIWFSKQSDIFHKVFWSFDIMDARWDPLAKALDVGVYRSLFELCLREDMSQEELQQRLNRYQSLVGENYTDTYWEHSRGDKFGLLVNNGILDIWGLFQNSLDETGSVSKPEMMRSIE